MKRKKNWQKLISIVCLLTLSIVPVTVLANDSIYVWSQADEALDVVAPTTNETENEIKQGSENPLNLESGGAVLMEQNSGKILYENHMHDQLRPASVTKVMSLLLIMEALEDGKIQLEDQVSCSELAASMGGSQIWLDTTETLSVDEMLKAMCVSSANDCTVAMAEYVAGSVENFVAKMNERAKELGMNDTTFKNCHGIDEDGHVTSSYDIAVMSRELLSKHPTITKYTTIWMDSLRGGKSELVNTNKLIRNYQGATGLKTGSTSLALYNLSASATKNGLSLIAVIMKAPTTKQRFAEAQKLLDYGFSSYSYKEFGKQGDTVRSVSVNKGVESNIGAVLEQSSGTVIEKGQEKQVVQTIQLPDKIEAPVEKGQKLGEVIYTVNAEEVGKTNIIAQKESKKVNLWNMYTHICNQWYCLFR